MTFVRPLFAVVVLAVAAIGCPQQAPEGSFGDAKPVKNDGSVHKAQPLPEAPPNFEGALVLAPRLQGNALTVELSLKPGYHAYAPGNEIGKPVSLRVAGCCSGSCWRQKGPRAFGNGGHPRGQGGSHSDRRQHHRLQWHSGSTGMHRQGLRPATQASVQDLSSRSYESGS
jgi:hypothetical protein